MELHDEPSEWRRLAVANGNRPSGSRRVANTKACRDAALATVQCPSAMLAGLSCEACFSSFALPCGTYFILLITYKVKEQIRDYKIILLNKRKIGQITT